MKTIIKILCAVVFNMILGAAVSFAIGAPVAMGMAVMAGVAVLWSMVPKTAGALREGVCVEIWTGEMIKSLREYLAGTWLDGIPDQSSVVKADSIHLVDCGVEPEVLVNNTTYPIPVQSLDDSDVVIKLDKFQTKVTPITDDELYAISHDKITRVKEAHSNALNDAKFAKAAHSLCAKENTAKTPVLKTTGDVDPATGRRKITLKDVIALKAALDKLKVPTAGRRLVLCTDHVNDLLESEQSFREQFNIDRNTGVIGMLYGFEIYTYAQTPLYSTAGKKLALDATAKAGEFQCSFAFYTQRVFKATGTTKMYYHEAATDPEKQENTINFRHYFIAMPKKEDAGAVMMSGYQAGV